MGRRNQGVDDSLPSPSLCAARPAPHCSRVWCHTPGDQWERSDIPVSLPSLLPSSDAPLYMFRRHAWQSVQCTAAAPAGSALRRSRAGTGRGRGKVWVDLSSDSEKPFWKPVLSHFRISPSSPPRLSAFLCPSFVFSLIVRKKQNLKGRGTSGWAAPQDTWHAKPHPRPAWGRRLSPKTPAGPKCPRFSPPWSVCRRPLEEWRSPGIAASSHLGSSLWWSAWLGREWLTATTTCRRPKWCRWCCWWWDWCCCCWPRPAGLSTRRRGRKRKKEARLTRSSVLCEELTRGLWNLGVA